MRDEIADGWKISQVESLIGLPRRDIQRACYQGEGGLGIVRPRNTSWGWRIYEVPDVARLFLFARMKRCSYSPEDVRREFESCESEADILERLDCCARESRERSDIEAGVALEACSLRCALAGASQECFTEMIDAAFARSRQSSSRALLGLAAEGFFSRFVKELAVLKSQGALANGGKAKKACMRAANEISSTCGLNCDDACELLVQALGFPGMGLACELWLGPGAHAYACAAVEAALIDALSGCIEKQQ